MGELISDLRAAVVASSRSGGAQETRRHSNFPPGLLGGQTGVHGGGVAGVGSTSLVNENGVGRYVCGKQLKGGSDIESLGNFVLDTAILEGAVEGVEGQACGEGGDIVVKVGGVESEGVGRPALV